MKIKEMNGHKEPMKPAMIAKFATEALCNEVEFWLKQTSGISNLTEVSPKTLN